MTEDRNDPRVDVRAPRAELDAARRVLEGSGWSMQQLVQACLRALVADQDGLLAQLRPYYREKRQPGRPRKNPDPQKPATPGE
ncbi:hypothetical protein [Actinoplanes rectilineatus]|uniref:hypothetical protein n=1 Tax=Actinoplanes rectilineatus TaxID=113571 RepID=UPI000A5E96F7|nr:hypothetical protein [Actinoplanes rectilineatus]